VALVGSVVKIKEGDGGQENLKLAIIVDIILPQTPRPKTMINTLKIKTKIFQNLNFL